LNGSQSTLRDYIHDHAGYYAGIVLAAAICLAAVLAAAYTGWLSVAAFALALALICFYFLAGSLLTASRKLRAPDFAFLFELGDIKPTEQVILPYVRRRDPALSLSRAMTTGLIFGVELYNPQLTPDSALARAGRRLLHPPKDPRLEWLDGDLDLLPLPDASVSAAIVDDTIGQFWQQGDRERLLKELRRVLKPDGRLLVAERTRSLSNWLALGPSAGKLGEPRYWRRLLTNAGFELLVEKQRHDLTTCWRARRVPAGSEYQLAFNFNVPPNPEGS
jgi:SAM-dependent methyltransferase